MSSPFAHHDMASPGPMSAPSGPDEADGSDADIPKRLMRVKVLYTFDDGNRTNCLARLPNALPIPVIPLDESTEIGVMELKICIQAIVASSPELIAKLEHDYTVYAYDYSEYETPLVGQGMLSWVLATASPTPTAPASQSKTMITGRVCKNILGLFSSNGIKETLEVKLKLVPVPSCSKSDFLQNMATYRNPSVVMPDGFDNHAWNSFLQAIPNAGSIEDQCQMAQGQSNARSGMSGMEHLHDMLTPNFAPDEDGYSTHPSIHGSRNGSPTPSQMSAGYPQAVGYSQSRPASRMSTQQHNEFSIDDDQSFEDGPGRKRARLTQADWNGRGSFGGNADSLRVAVSTSASLRGFRPSAVGNSSASNDMLPRAPTPRPGEKRQGKLNRPSMMSNLRRHSSTPNYTTPYPPSDQAFSRMDSGIYSLGDDEASSRLGSPSPEIPSSPPEYTPVDGSLPPSSPGLPELPYVPDSGFQSEAQSDYVVEQPRVAKAPPEWSNHHLKRQQRGEFLWLEVKSGSHDDLPRQSYPDFDPLSQRNAHSAVVRSEFSTKPTHHRGGRAKSRIVPAPPSGHNTVLPVPPSATSPGESNVLPSTEGQSYAYQPHPAGANPNGMQPPPHPAGADSRPTEAAGPLTAPRYWQSDNANEVGRTSAESQPPPEQQPFLISRATAQAEHSHEASHGPASAGVILPPKKDPSSKQGQSRNRGRNAPMPRSHSWAAGGSSDIDSDGYAGPTSRSRGGSGVVRLKTITTQLDQSVLAGQPVKHCRNCGEIKTPTWRPYWTRVHEGTGADLQVSGKAGIHMIESLTKGDNGQTTKYRVYKQYSHLTPEDKKHSLYEQYIFCNPCGDWIRKYATIRPAACWDPTQKKEMKKRAPRRPRTKPGELTSDLPLPSSEWDLLPSSTFPQFSNHPQLTDPFLPSEGPTPLPPSEAPLPIASYPQDTRPPAAQPVSENMQTLGPALPNNSDAPHGDQEWNRASAMVALHHAIQSSPARLLGSQASPIEIREELTPQPTRRLLFPSPRKTGEFKSLDGIDGQKSTTASPTAPLTPAPDTSTTQPAPRTGGAQEHDLLDKENLPPVDDTDEFDHLFDDTLIPATPGKITPDTARSIAKLLKTPTPHKPTTRGSQTPRTSSKRSAAALGDHLDTPSRSRQKLSPANAMTPFTASLNQFISDGHISSPSRAFNWALTSSPNRGGDRFAFDDDPFSNDIPAMPSSPPLLSTGFHDSFSGGGDLGFEMFEDATATEGLRGWNGMFFDTVEVVQEEDFDALDGTPDESGAGDRDSQSGAGRRSRSPPNNGITSVAILEGGADAPAPVLGPACTGVLA